MQHSKLMPRDRPMNDFVQYTAPTPKIDRVLYPGRQEGIATGGERHSI